MDIPKLALILNLEAKSSKPFLLHCSSSAFTQPVGRNYWVTGWLWNLIEHQVFRDHTVIIPHSVSSEVIEQDKNFPQLLYFKFLSKRLKIKCFPIICPGPCDRGAIWVIQWYSGKRIFCMAFAGPIYVWKLYCGIYLSTQAWAPRFPGLKETVTS